MRSHKILWCFESFFNTLRPRQNGRQFTDGIFKYIFLNENVWIPIKISLKFVPKGPINNIPSLVQIMVWRRPGAKPFSEPMMVSLLTHICVSRPQWVHSLRPSDAIWCLGTWGHFKNTYELLNVRSLKISTLYKTCIFKCMGKIFCMEFQRYPLKFHTKYLTHTLKDVHFMHKWKFKSS